LIPQKRIHHLVKDLLGPPSGEETRLSKSDEKIADRSRVEDVGVVDRANDHERPKLIVEPEVLGLARELVCDFAPERIILPFVLEDVG
jgi:hypothetical protein